MHAKVLIIDDFDIVRTNLKRILAQLGARQIIEASDGQQAIEILSQSENISTPFDMIFLDWNMPRMNGIEFLAKIKADSRFNQIPVVMITAEREKKSVLQALSSGASDYIVKPFRLFIIQEKYEKFAGPRKTA